ncbi:cellulase (glycosyl hydrolase family 5) subfamily protein [Chrysochromulina tobinii]|uniref:Cellulase (Glycosyl hydrolase family 5) subfamily protein n=1 Tax=Chrysochromulina tobinii TaxID=1460289 RepID=A0A0M0LPS3_9EUKA|nr:cellulase (glycosyl hydrolase family 5) subfamily protein [Chrysochromulina tobinii]|eukprot:KOO52986.1 cellulase (glycosyl hydrolase family 5) subfamily protein [Chrysochromulina sp. CCMP291]
MESVDGSLRANGHPFQLKGVVWWGAESALGLPGGLERRSVDELLGLVRHYGFNAIKIPFLHQHVLFDEPIPATSFDHGRNPYLLEEGSGRPLKYIDALRVISRRAAGQGLLVWLVAHSLETLWYSRSINELTVLDSWTSVSHRLCPQWNIIGVDLKNLPSAASWGKNTPPSVESEPTDWDVAAARLGDHVNAKCPRWLIGVQGVGATPGAAQDPEMEFATMYPTYHDGENLVGARRRPVELHDPTRLVYMAHSYGPGVHVLPYMESEDFPQNTELVWQEHFLFVLQKAEAREPASLILHLGGPFEGSPRDLAWQTWALQYAKEKSLNLFYDGLNPKSGVGGHSPFEPEQLAAVAAGGHRASRDGPRINNTGGLMRDDWTRTWDAKLQKLMAVQSTHVGTALAVALLSLLLLLRQLGLFVTHCAPVRRWLDARTPSGLLPLTTLVWTLLNVPLATAAVATTALVPLPKSKKSKATNGSAKGAEAEQIEEEEQGLMAALDDAATPTSTGAAAGAAGATAGRKKGGGAKGSTKANGGNQSAEADADSDGLENMPTTHASAGATGSARAPAVAPPPRPKAAEAAMESRRASRGSGAKASSGLSSGRRGAAAAPMVEKDVEDEETFSPREEHRRRAERLTRSSFNPVEEDAEDARHRRTAAMDL